MAQDRPSQDLCYDSFDGATRASRTRNGSYASAARCPVNGTTRKLLFPSNHTHGFGLGLPQGPRIPYPNTDYLRIPLRNQGASRNLFPAIMASLCLRVCFVGLAVSSG